MKFNYKNLVVDNIFTDVEIGDIYKHVDATEDSKRQLIEDFGHIAYYSWLPPHIVDKIITTVQELTNINVELINLSFARYSSASGIEPKLFPHVDETFKEPRLTFDIQVSSTLDWPIIVEGRSFTLKDNQALTFSGTHQIHWRDHVTFGPNDYVDMIFCHFGEVGAEKDTLGDDHYMPLIRRRDILSEKYWQEKENN